MNFKLLILDVDGVLTDGTKLYDLNGRVSHKRFNDKDFTAIKRFTCAGVKVVWLSGDDAVNRSVAASRGIPFFNARCTSDGVICKASFVPVFADRFGVPSKDMAYVGDDYFDLDIMLAVRYRYCPQDATADVLRVCEHRVLNRKGGEGVVAALYERYRQANDLIDDAEAVRLADAKELNSKGNP